MNENGAIGGLESEYIQKHHRHDPGENQCSSVLVKHINAPVHLVHLSLCIIYICMLHFYVLKL